MKQASSSMDVTYRVALGPQAPADERRDALGQLQKLHMPSARELIKNHDATALVDHIRNVMAEEEMMVKAVRQPMLVDQYSAKRRKLKAKGMQSVYLDDMQINVQGDWYDRPGVFTFDAMRDMIDQVPVLSAVLFTRQRQVQQFCQTGVHDKPGFSIRLKDDDKTPSKDVQKVMKSIESFFLNCGTETNPRKRLRMRRDNFSNFMTKLTRDTLSMDSMPIETEFKYDMDKGLDGIYAVDGSTIRLCTEDGFRDNTDFFALQVVEGNLRHAYTYDNLIYVPRNPRTDVNCGGYGFSETEVLIRTVTGFLNAFNYNTKYFDSNAIPKGILHMCGDFAEQDMASFRRFWNAMVRGVNNAWTLPVLFSKDMESKAEFEALGVEQDEMMFSKWMTFLVAIICAIYTISPDEINFESFSAEKSSLSGKDTGEKLASSKDKGLKPLMSYYASTFTDYIVSTWGDQYCFWWNGLEEEDAEQAFEEVKLVSTVNELRAQRGDELIKEPWGDAPLNPQLIQVWQGGQQEDFGKGEDLGEGGEGDGTQEDDGFGAYDENEEASAASGQGSYAENENPETPTPPPGAPPMKKSDFGLPPFAIGDLFDGP